MEYFFECPYCGEKISIILDLSETEQNYIEDCEVCCSPINISFKAEGHNIKNFEAIKIN